MGVAEELINCVVDSSQIPTGKRRQAVLYELRSHLEDLVVAAREAGQTDDEIEKLVVAHFGDPAHIAEGFAWVYRRERAMLRISVFLLSTVAVASLLMPAIFALQAGVAIGFGIPVLNVLASRHTAIETLDVVFTVTAYTGFVALEKLFSRNQFPKALALLALAFAVVMGASVIAKYRAAFLVFGFVNGVFFRAIQVFMKSRMAQTGIALAGFALFGFISFEVMPSRFQYALAASCASWLVMGAGYRLMADLVARVDAALSNGLQRI
jgi:hypothetical protein